jgi:large subunit ribosomal protein L3
MIKGSVPGADNGYLLISDAVKKGAHPQAPFPAGVKKSPEAPAAEAEKPDAADEQPQA